MKLGQQMKLSPRLIQSMEILQLSALALEERIEQELESNIALELAEPDSEEEHPEQVEGPDGDDPEMRVGEDTRDSAEDFQRLDAMSSAYRDTWDDEQSRPSTRHDGERDLKMDAMANTPSKSESLVEQLHQQWALLESEVDAAIYLVGRRLIEYINDDGLLDVDLETVIEQNRQVGGIDWTMQLLEEALGRLQQELEPPGIAARDVKECLLLQVEHLRKQDEAMDSTAISDVEHLIKDHYEDLLQNRLPRIEQQSGISMQRIQAAKELMSRWLKLSPGRDLVDREVPPIIPDVIAEYDSEQDAYYAVFAGDRLSRLQLSRRYSRMAESSELDKEARDFINTNIRNATWLIDAIDQRKATLLRVTNVVLSRQREFFDHGPQHLKPLPMTEVADQLGIHVATVSRAVSEKWIQTPRGMLPLRRFFSGGTETDSGEDISWDAVKELLREIVDAEDKSRPLSDQAISDALKERGVTIARRTVVKYREQLDIPPARRRKIHG